MSKLALLRAKANLTQEAVASALSIDRSTVAKWETGKAYPQTNKLPQLSALYGCSIDELFMCFQTQNSEAV